MYRHPHTEFLLQDDMIYFVAFQGYVKIQCSLFQCRNIRLHYIWEVVYAAQLIIYKTVSLISHFAFCQRHYQSLMHCAYVINNRQSSNVRITFQEMSFGGPDYLGGLPGEHRCTLGGITIADILRWTNLNREISNICGQ